MSEFGADYDAAAEAALAQVRADVQAAQLRLTASERYAAATEAVRGEAASADGTVRAIVDSAGRLTDLELSDTVSNLTRRALSDLVTHTIAEASLRARSEVLQLTEAAFGADDPTTQAIRVQYLELPEPKADEEARRPSTGRPPGYIIG